MFMTVKQASEKWGISDRRIRVLCSEGKIPGAAGRFRLMRRNRQTEGISQRKASLHRSTARRKSLMAEDL